MGSLNDIVTCTISTTGAPVQVPNFNVPLVMDYHSRFAELIRWYTSLDGMVSDGFTVHDGAYRAASAIMAQTPAPARFAVGRRTTAPDLTVELTPVAANSRLYSVSLLGPAGLTATASYTSDSGATVAEICAGLLSAINTAAVGITATGGTTSVVCKAASAGLHFAVAPLDAALIAAQQTHADPGIAADLAAIKLVSSDYYGVTLSTAGKSETIAAASWVESNGKMGYFSTQDSDCRGSGTSDVGGTIKASSEYRSMAQYGLRAGFEHPGAAKMAYMFARAPGSVTGKFNQLASVTRDALSETDLTNLNAKNIGWFTDFSGVGITGEGKTAAGEWQDFIRDRDWFVANMQADVFTVLTSQDKVAFDDRGINSVAGAIRKRISLGVTAGFLTGDPAATVTVPKASDVSTTDKRNRVLNGLRFSAPVAGAIHTVAIAGTVTF